MFDEKILEAARALQKVIQEHNGPDHDVLHNAYNRGEHIYTVECGLYGVQLHIQWPAMTELLKVYPWYCMKVSFMGGGNVHVEVINKDVTYTNVVDSHELEETFQELTGRKAEYNTLSGLFNMVLWEIQHGEEVRK